DKDLRDKLARVVEEAREVAETAARYTLQQLSIGESSPYKHLSAEERDLRRRLRAHGRQLGDTRKPRDETQEIERLLEEVAYQHWHRMLFAKFLAENNLLMYPDPVSPVPVSLEECEELARDEGAKNGWELASRFAQNMLPQIFRADSPVFEIDLAPEYQRRLEYLLGELPSEVFEASDSLGWVYQFWQSKRKKEINESEVKIGARELPAVTQLFTEPYMVSFLLDNSIGAWWAARTLSDCDLLTADSEEELRRRASVPRVSLEYLRFSKDEAGKWWPAAGSQDNWPNKLSELKCLDPCCGSGHFLVGILLMLVPLRMRLEGMTANKAVDAVIADNLYGLELDQRCVQLAVFALALEAWRYPEAGGYRTLPSFNIACSGLAPNSTREQWKQIAARIKGDLYPMTAKTSVADARVASYEQFETGMAKLYDLFSDAPTLGSLINPTKIQGDLYSASFEQISELLGLVLEKEECNSEYYEMGITAQGLSEAAKILSSQFHLIITNVPYLKSGYHDDTLKDYCERHYHIGKYDLATVFLQRIQEMLADNGLSCLVMPQNWLSLTYYKQLRLHHLENSRFLLIANLGAGAFETISGEVVKVGLVMMSNATSAENAQHIGFELDSSTDIPAKMKNLAYGRFHIAEQSRHLGNPDSRISFELSGFDDDLLMNKYCTPNTGLQTGDLPRYAFMFWEVPRIKKPWVLFQGTPDKTTYFGG
ncbi:MAG: N-6 DNA methylase, partial [Firmicutes bacterium]|nr:N-6 DNA methylase [Bacillota bacterium]